MSTDKLICNKCGMLITNDTYLMLVDPVWEQACLGKPKAILCSVCIEENLGRKLVAVDLTQCLQNTAHNTYTKRILEEADRLRRIREQHEAQLEQAKASIDHRCDAFPFCTDCPASGKCEDEEELSNT